MFTRIIFESFRRQRRRKFLAGVAIALGVAVATAMIAVATNIGDKISRELRSYGANLVVYPDADTLDVEIGGVSLKPAADGAFLKESDLAAIRGIFWHNNIVGFAPMLPLNANVEGRSLPCSEPTSPSPSCTERRRSPPAFARRIPGGRWRASGRPMIPVTSCWASGLQPN